MATVDLKKIAECGVKNVASGQTTSIGNLWKDQASVVVFLRRWGCMFCRLWATELSEIEPILQKNNVKLIGIGPEELGQEEFLKGNYFKGDLYTVTDKNSYNLLGFKRFSYLSVLASLLWKESRDAASKGKKLNLGGNIKGDGLQNGGLLILDKNGKLLKHFIQNGPAEHLSNAAILEALNLSDGSQPSKPEVIITSAKCD